MLIVPFSALAEDTNLTRSDAFLLMWESIDRPALETASSYDDVQEEDIGYQEISYGKRRGILPDEDLFHPNDPILLKDALLWLYRTRNVRELPEMQEEDLEEMLSEYPLLQKEKPLESRISSEELIDVIRTLDETLKSEVHEVSFYGEDFHGAGTAFGEKFDMYALTAAHRSFPHNTLVKVTNTEDKKSVVVRINDRGPYVHGRDMDLSRAAFEKIAHPGQGVIEATFERLGDKDLVDACAEKQSLYQKRITKNVRLFRGIPHSFTLGNSLILQSNKAFVIRSIVFPDGQNLRIQDFVNPNEKYEFSPDIMGQYSFWIGDSFGHMREMRMNVHSCEILL